MNSFYAYCFLHVWHITKMPCCHCGRRFGDPNALQQHQRSKAHCYCRECARFFVHPDALEQHRSALHSFTCVDCDRTFVRPEALQRHQKSTKHCYCCECDRSFVHPALPQSLYVAIPPSARGKQDTPLGMDLVYVTVRPKG